MSDNKKDWLGDIVVTSFIASFVGIMLGGMLGISWLMTLGALALVPLSIFFIGAIFLRLCDLILEIRDVFRKR